MLDLDNTTAVNNAYPDILHYCSSIERALLQNKQASKMIFTSDNTACRGQTGQTFMSSKPYCWTNINVGLKLNRKTHNVIKPIRASKPSHMSGLSC